MNTRTAHSKLMDGGIGSALHEATEIDGLAARYVNDTVAEYLVPVNADVEDIPVILVPEMAVLIEWRADFFPLGPGLRSISPARETGNKDGGRGHVRAVHARRSRTVR
jgi:hypothetical protein